MKKMQKFFAVFLVLILMINMGTSQFAFASDNTSILDNSVLSNKETDTEVNPSSDISRDKIITKLYIDDDKTDFLTGSEVSVYAGVELSGNDTFLNGAYMIVSIPKEYLDTSYSNKGLNVSSGSSLLKTPQVTSDQDLYYIRYEYKDLKGGTFVNLPFIFKTKNYTTPPDSQITLTAKLYDSESSEIGDRSLTITSKASFKYETRGNGRSFTESRIREGNPTHTSSNPDELDVVYAQWGYKNTIYSNSSSLGVYIPKKMKVIVKLAEGVIFDSSFSTKNKEWNYDEQNRILTKIIKPSNSSEYSYDAIYLTITGDAKDGYVITNTNTAKISIPVEKRWIGKSLDEATINLIADGTKIDTVTLNEDNEWKHVFEDLPQYDSKDGHEIVYTVAEDQLNGYEVSIAGNAASGFIVVNKEVKDITITVDDKTNKKTQNKTNNSNKTSSDKQIKTGDSYQVETWLIIEAIVAICIIAIVFKSRDQNKK